MYTNYVRCYISTDERKNMRLNMLWKIKILLHERVKKYYQEHKEEKAEYDKKYRAKIKIKEEIMIKNEDN